jgi:hypothetical protein
MGSYHITYLLAIISIFKVEMVLVPLPLPIFLRSHHDFLFQLYISSHYFDMQLL